MDKPTIVPELYWSLPTPRDFIYRIAHGATNSRIIWINMPHEVPAGTWDHIKMGLQQGNIDPVISLKIGRGTDIAAEIGAHFDVPRLTAAELMHHQAREPSAVILLPEGDGGTKNCSDFAEAFLHAIGQGVGNIHLVIGGHEESMTEDQFTDDIRAVVFDGGLSPDEMDAYVALRMITRPGPGSTRLSRAIVTEFAGFDAELAETLMQFNESQLVNITDHLKSLMGSDPVRWKHDSWLIRTRSAADRRATHVLHDQFLADHGAGDARTQASDRIRRRYWKACVKTLTPWLEERRLKVIKIFDKQLQAEAALNNGKILKPIGPRFVEIDPDEVEYNNIVGMYRNGKITTGSTTEVCVVSVCGLAKDVRDEIAHLRMPKPRDVKNLITEMDRLIG